MPEDSEHVMNEIIENMASKLYFHGHPINRLEAKQELHLKVVDNLQADLETAMWNLYKEYETEFKNQEIFAPAGDLVKNGTPALGTPATHEYELLHALIESPRLLSKFVTKRRFTYLALQPGQPQ